MKFPLIKWYILDGKTPVPVKDIIEWGGFMESDKRIVKVTYLMNGAKVSTVFLGLDHGYDGDVVLFETMVFGGRLDQEQWRYRTWDEAEIGHENVVRLAQPSLKIFFLSIWNYIKKLFTK